MPHACDEVRFASALFLHWSNTNPDVQTYQSAQNHPIWSCRLSHRGQSSPGSAYSRKSALNPQLSPHIMSAQSSVLTQSSVGLESDILNTLVRYVPLFEHLAAHL